jgi:hypothetical protein
MKSKTFFAVTSYFLKKKKKKNVPNKIYNIEVICANFKHVFRILQLAVEILAQKTCRSVVINMWTVGWRALRFHGNSLATVTEFVIVYFFLS